MSRPAILVLESNDWDREHISTHLRELSTPVRIVEPAQLETTGVRIDVVILGLSDAISLETARAQLAKARERSPKAQLIVCAPRDTVDLDSKILELGARAFVLKPIDETTFVSLLEETLSQITLRKQREAYARNAKKSSATSEIVGRSEAIRSVMTLLKRVARSSNTSVLLLGESGVGKSLFARTIHEKSDQSRGPFIEINCATLPANLLESELFGYEPGAFTDARSRKLGLIELAHGGTLFLDEITEVDLPTQAKLLKVLDSKRFRRLGGDAEINVDIRVVAATNRDLKETVRRGEFREDLYYRLNVVEINIPPLRERREDADLITAQYFEFFRRKFNKPDLELSDGAWALIREYEWPGNVRELINALERAVLLSNGPFLEKEDLPVRQSPKPRVVSVHADDTAVEIDLPADGISIERVERALIEQTLKLTRGNVSRAAEMLGISRGALRNKLSRHRIEPRTYRGRVLVET
ncbi:MAG: sigma-54 dependent transcriptional regulator [Candidatus Latescibacterota bacterium]|jgi:DNA-binding NtrC family response regulator